MKLPQELLDHINEALHFHPINAKKGISEFSAVAIIRENEIYYFERKINIKEKK